MEHGFDVILLFLYRPIQGFWQYSACTTTSPPTEPLHSTQWIAFYLLNRKQYVVVQGESPTDTSVVSGVPQGSVLGTLLFLSYISQVPLSNGAQMTLYADDLLLIKPIKDANDYISLQQDITTITNHIEELHLTQSVSIFLGQEKTAASPSSRNIHQ